MRERRANIINQRKKMSKKENSVSIGWGGMILLSIIGSIILGVNSNKYASKLNSFRPDYPFPGIYDLSPCFLMLGVCILFKVAFEFVIVYISDSIMDLKYLKPDQTEIRKLIRKKLAVNIFKFSYYTSASIFGYFTLVKSDYFPFELGGQNSLWSILEKGYPAAFFFNKPRLFVMHYCFCLTYSFIDLIWLLFIYARQSDFQTMLVHHICAISLIIFSYTTNFSHLGTVILYLHNITDVIVYINRAMLYSRIYEPIKKVLPIILISAFIYRLYVLGKILYSIYYDIQWDKELITFSLWFFLVFLFILHANWTFILSKNFYVLLVYGTILDTFKFNQHKSAKQLKNK